MFNPYNEARNKHWSDFRALAWIVYMLLMIVSFVVSIWLSAFKIMPVSVAIMFATFIFFGLILTNMRVTTGTTTSYESRKKNPE